MAGQTIYRLWKGSPDTVSGTVTQMKAVLGGKGYGLYEMVKAGLNVPPAFCIPTSACNEFLALGTADRVLFLDKLMSSVTDSLDELAAHFGYMPLVSVRSGAPASMPGMMDTILNVGLNDTDLAWWSEKLGDRAALDSYRRLIQMLGSTAYEVPSGVFDFQLAKVKKAYGAKSDADLSIEALADLISRYLVAFEKAAGQPFPQEPYDQLRAAVRAVFKSWMNERAIEYRKINGLSDSMGTAVNVQAMVFGNMGADSGTGVLFTRDPMTGEPGMMGEFLIDAQGEDVVAGIRTPMDVWDMNTVELQDTCWPDIYTKLVQVCAHLEGFYRDMVDIEFTVQKGVLFILQSRVGKRSAQAAVRIAVDLVTELGLTPKEALQRLTRQQITIMRRPVIHHDFKDAPDHTGIPACPGVVSGVVVTSSQAAVSCKEPCILVTEETSPDDIAGMNAAVGILTRIGGTTSHAAVVARAMDKPCVVGCTDLDVSMLSKLMYGYKVSIDGSTGRVWLGKVVPTIDNSGSEHLSTLTRWAVEDQNLASTVDLGPDMDVVVSLTELWDDPPAAAAALGEMWATHGSDLGRVILDLRTPLDHVTAKEKELLSAFGDPSIGAFDGRVASCFGAASFTGLRVIVGGGMAAVSDFAEKNPDKAVLCGPMTTVKDLWSKAVVITPEAVKALFGTKAAFDKIVKLLEKDGQKVTYMGAVGHPETALFTAVSV